MGKIRKLLSSTILSAEDKVLATSSALNVLTFLAIAFSNLSFPDGFYNLARALTSSTGIFAPKLYINNISPILFIASIGAVILYGSTNPAMAGFWFLEGLGNLITTFDKENGHKWAGLFYIGSSISLLLANPVAGAFSVMADLISINALPEFKKSVVNLFLAAELTFNKPDIKITNPRIEEVRINNSK